MDLKRYIGAVKDFPKPGILFRDVSPLLRNPRAVRKVVDHFARNWSGKVDAIVALDARGFIFGSLVAHHLRLPFVMMRKKGKLPGSTVSVSYELEYGNNVLEMQSGALEKGMKVLVVDDLLATGGSANAAAALVTRVGASVAGFAFVIELCALGGKHRLPSGVPVDSLILYDKKLAAAAA